MSPTERLLEIEARQLATLGAEIAGRLRHFADQVEQRTAQVRDGYYPATRTMGPDFAAAVADIQNDFGWVVANARMDRLTRQAAKAQDALLAVHLERKVDDAIAATRSDFEVPGF